MRTLKDVYLCFVTKKPNYDRILFYGFYGHTIIAKYSKDLFILISACIPINAHPSPDLKIKSTGRPGLVQNNKNEKNNNLYKKLRN